MIGIKSFHESTRLQESHIERPRIVFPLLNRSASTLRKDPKKRPMIKRKNIEYGIWNIGSKNINGIISNYLMYHTSLSFQLFYLSFQRRLESLTLPVSSLRLPAELVGRQGSLISRVSLSSCHPCAGRDLIIIMTDKDLSNQDSFH